MSGMNSTVAAQVQDIREIYTGYEADVGMLALSVWEYCITFDQEVTTVWQAKKFSAASFLLLFARYGMLLEVFIEGLRVFLGISSCKVSIISLETLSLLSYIVIALFSALRVSAMWDRNCIIFSVIFILGLTPVATDIFYVSHYKYAHIGKPLPMSCSARPDISPELYQTLTIVTRTSLITMDLIVLILTWMKTYSQIQSARQLSTAAPIVICLARDGTVYFVVLLAMNIVQMLLGASLVKGHSIGGFMAALPPILINRFILNLRQAMDPSTPGSDTDVPTHISEVAFRRSDTMFANLGEPLRLAYGQSQGIADKYEDHFSGSLLSFDDSHSGCMRFAPRSQSVDLAARRGVVESPVSSGVLVLSDSKTDFGRRTSVDKIDSATIC